MSKNADAKELSSVGYDKWEEGKAAEAVELWLQAYARGDHAIALNIGYMYDVGEGVDKDISKAFLWYKRAWRYAKKDVAAADNIALLYAELGRRRRALYWWNKGVARDNHDSALDLAKFLLKTGGRKARSRIIELLEMAVRGQAWVDMSLASKEEAQALLAEIRAASKPITGG